MRLSCWLSVLFTLVIGGCGSYGGPVAHQYQERCPFQPSWREDPADKTRPTPGNPVFTLKLTSQGEWVDRCDYADLLQELQANLEPLKIVLYVHGWKHGPESADRRRFGELIEKMAVAERSKTSSSSAEPRKIVGIYIGWPAHTIDIPIFEELTYWGRQKAADRISQSGIVAKIVAGIASVRGAISSTPIPHQPLNQDQFIFIGHSFGARILLTATSQLLIQDVEGAHPGSRQPTLSGPPTDPESIQGWPYRCVPSKRLIVLLNPAVEAFTYSFFHNTRRSDHEFRVGQQPLILMVATNNDSATRTAFPIGQAIGLNWHDKELTTIGNYKPFQTHTLTKTRICRSGVSWFDGFQTKDGLCLERLVVEDEVDGVASRETMINRRMGAVRMGNQSRNPFVVAHTNANIVDGHNGIWGDDFTTWLITFINTREAEAPCI
jgi:hypothetical protein